MPGSVGLIERYLAKIDRAGILSSTARAAFVAIPRLTRDYPNNHDVIEEGQRSTRACLVETGLVSRYRTLQSGVRQIVSFHITADMVDLQSVLFVVTDHAIRTHGPTRIVSLAHHDILAVAEDFPDIARALWFDTLVDAAIFREWTVNVGRRNSRQRTAHLLLELATKFAAVGLLANDTFEFPVTQSDLADALAITSVHLNRIMQWLRGERYIRTHLRSITIENWPDMIALAGFRPGYLHPEGPKLAGRQQPRERDG